MNRLAIEIVMVLVAVGAFTGYVWHAGGASCRNNDTVAEARQENHNTVVTALAVQEITHEKDAYVNAKLVPITGAPHVVCVRNTPPETLRAADSTGPQGHGEPGLPEGTGKYLQPVTDISQSAIEIGRDANAQVKALRDYITNVCLVR